MGASSHIYEPCPPDWIGGGHYSINRIRSDHAWELLRRRFPDGRASESGWLLLSTSGVHGTYIALDDLGDVRQEIIDDGDAGSPLITFMIVDPRLVRIMYGNVPVETPAQEAFLRGLVASSVGCVIQSQCGNTP